MRIISCFILLFCSGLVTGQSTVYRKIAQRRDQMNASVWTGIDSFRWNYNANASLVGQDALKTDASGNWNNWFRYTYTLDANERVTMQVRENWNGSAWVKSTSYSYSFDGNGNLLTVLYEVWNGSAWQETGKYEYTGYNAQHHYTQESTFSKSGSNWINLTKRTIQYYPNQYQPQYIEEYTWNTGTSTWDSLKRYYYTFNLDSIGSITTSIPSPSGWFLSTRYVANFTGLPLMKTSDYKQEWDTIPNPDVWQDKERNLYTYTTFDSIEQVQHELNSTFGWFPDNRWSYTYNGNNRMAEKFREIYSGSWSNDSRSVFAYNGNKVSSMTDYTGSGTAWNPLRQTVYSYASFDSLVYKQVDTFDGSGYFPSRRDFYYYNAYTVGVSNWQSVIDQVDLFPNPAYQSISFGATTSSDVDAEIVLYDMTGHTRMRTAQMLHAGKSERSLNLGPLPAGHYLFTLRELHSGEILFRQQITKLY